MARDPICGMYVDEKKTELKAAEHGIDYYFCSSNCLKEFTKPHVEFRKLKMLTAFSLILGGLVAFFEYVYPVSFIPNNFLLFLLATPVQFVAGWKFYVGTRDALKARQANMDSLIAIGTTAAWLYSFIVTFLPSFLPASGVYYTESALIIGFILLGRTMEHMVKGKASAAIRKLMDLQPKMARLIKGGREKRVPVEELDVGDMFLVKPGERIATDGVVVYGLSSVDESMITGESIPVEKKKGSQVIGGTINKSGALKIKATKVGADTALASIVKMVEEAILSRSSMQRLADTVSSYFVPAVVAVSISSFLFWYYFAGLAFPLAFIILVSVLIIACPCALGIATPAAIMIGASRGAQNGILIKGGEHLEKARKINVIVFDKTGTLTKGKPEVTDVIALGMKEKDAVFYAAVAEKNSEHPLAEAVLNKAKEMKMRIPDAKSFRAVSGKGVVAKYGREILLGNRALMQSRKISTDEIEEKLQELENEGKTAVVLAVGRRLAGIIAVADTIKEESKEAVKRLREMGIEVIMLTGDNRRTAEAIARQLGIRNVLAEVLPQDKAKEIKKLQKSGVVAMVGDGINDAPALAQADVGIAIGSGTDIAKETGGIVLIKSDVRDVVKSILLSRKTVSKIKQNLFWAFVYNIALIPVAAGALYPFGILLNPIYAAIAMAFSSVTVVTNSLLLARYKIR